MSARPPARSVDSCPRTVAMSGRSPRRTAAAGIGGSRRSAAPSAACAPGRPRSGFRTGGTAGAAGRARARAAFRRRRSAGAGAARPPAGCAGSATVSAGVHGHSRSANSDSAAKIVPMPGDDRLVEQHLGDRCRSSGGPAPQRLVDVDRLAEQVRSEMADERVLVAGAHHVEHAQVVPDRRPLAPWRGRRGPAASGRPTPASRCARSASTPPCAGACAGSGRRRSGSAGACRRSASRAPCGPPGRPWRRSASAGRTAPAPGRRSPARTGRRSGAGRHPRARALTTDRAAADRAGSPRTRPPRTPARAVRAGLRRGPRRRRRAGS